LRLVGLAVLALLSFALVALLADRGGELLDSAGFSTPSDDRIIHVLETGNAKLPGPPVSEESAVRLPIRQYKKWTALAGFSGSQNFTLPLPRHTKFDKAVLILDVNAELEEGTTGRIKFEVNSQERGEIVLNSGSSGFLIKIPLEPIDMARSWVSVTMSVKGNNPKAECTSDWTGGVVVTVEPTSYIELEVTEPITALEDKLLLSGSPARLIWRTEGTESEPGNSFDLPWQWDPFVLDAVFVEASQALENDVETTLADLIEFRQDRFEKFLLAEQLEGNVVAEWPLPVAAFLENSAEREFRNQTKWIVNYTRAEMPSRQLPNLFNLDLTANSSDSEVSWLLTVTLNGHIVHSEQVASAAESIQREIQLREGVQGLQNVLKVTLTSNEEKIGRCVQGHPAVAQLGQATVFNRTGEETDPIYAGLLDAASPNLDLYVAQTVNAEEANFGFFTLSKIFKGNSIQGAQADVGENALEHGLIALIDSAQFSRVFTEHEDDLPSIWIAFTAITSAPSPTVFVFKGDDPLMKKAVELHKPISALFVMPPGFTL
jgi:hypothetical protein